MEYEIINKADVEINSTIKAIETKIIPEQTITEEKIFVLSELQLEINNLKNQIVKIQKQVNDKEAFIADVKFKTGLK